MLAKSQSTPKSTPSNSASDAISIYLQTCVSLDGSRFIAAPGSFFLTPKLSSDGQRIQEATLQPDFRQNRTGISAFSRDSSKI